MSDGDETDFSTQVPIVRCAWVHVAMSYCVRHSMPLSLEDLAPAALHGTEKPLGMIARGSGTFRVGSHGGSTVGRYNNNNNQAF
jgi:hypothetical protein